MTAILNSFLGIGTFVLDLLRSLGVNETLWVFMGCFLVSFCSLFFLVFKPYMAAFESRQERTLGSEESAIRIIDEANQLHAEFEKKAKAANAEIRSKFEASRTEAMKEYDRIIQDAQAEAQTVVLAARTNLQREVDAAKKQLNEFAPEIANAVCKKMAGTELQ